MRLLLSSFLQALRFACVAAAVLASVAFTIVLSYVITVSNDAAMGLVLNFILGFFAVLCVAWLVIYLDEAYG